MKTNVSIKFNSIEEYREIEKKLIEMGYKKGHYICNAEDYSFVYMHKNKDFHIYNFILDEKLYNSLEEFLNDN